MAYPGIQSISGCLSHLRKNKSKLTNQMQAILKMSPSMVNLIHHFGSSVFHDRTSYLTLAVGRMVHNMNKIMMICCIVLVHAWIPLYHLNQLIEFHFEYMLN